MTALQPMKIGDILDAAFRLFRRRFVTFIGIALVVSAPSSLVIAFMMRAARTFLPKMEPDDDSLLNVVLGPFGRGGRACFALLGRGSSQPIDLQGLDLQVLSTIASAALILLVFLLVFSIVYPLCTGALVLNISASYLGETIGATESYARAFRRLWRLLMAQAWTTILVLLGLCLCVVPGVVIWLQLMLVSQVVLLEEGRAWPALGRSRALMADHLGRGFLLTVIVGVLGMVVSAVLGAVVRAVPWPLPIMGDFLSTLIEQSLMLPLSIATVVLFYYDLRVRKEGFGLHHLATVMDEYRPL